MGDWKIITPEETVNLIGNPSVEVATTGWTADGSAIARVTSEQLFGIAALRINTDNAAANEGAYYAIDPAGGAGIPYTGSMWAKRLGGGTVELRLRDVTNGNATNSDPVTLTDDWQLLTVTHTLTGASNILRLIVRTDVQQNITFYVDGAQIEELGYETTYCDGEQAGCEWLGADHASTSRRSALARAGGRVQDLGDDYGFDVKDALGLGMAPVILNVRPFALIPGGELGSRKVDVRRFTLVGQLMGAGADCDIIEARDDLLAVLTMDPFGVNQPARLRYTGADEIREIDAYYEAGLEGNQKAEWLDTKEIAIALRLTAVDPFWTQVGNHGAVLDTNDALAASRMAGRVNGAWENLGAPATGAQMNAVRIGPDRLVYYGGDSVNIDGIAAADYLAYYDPAIDDWSAVAAGGTGGVNAIAFGADDLLYFGGDFLNWNAVGAADYIATWNGAAYAALGAGGTGEVNGIAIAQDGNVYFGGDFLNWNAIADADYLAYWDGAAYAGLFPLDDVAHAVAIAPNGYVYVGGEFHMSGGLTLNHIAVVTIEPGETGIGHLAEGLNGDVYAIAISEDGTVYVGGTFTESTSGVTLNYIGKWDGTAWTALGEGLDSSGTPAVRGIRIADNGDVWVSGEIDSSGEVTFNGVAVWNGSVWRGADWELNSDDPVRAIDVGLYDPMIPNNFDAYVAVEASVASTAAGTTTATNDGNVKAYPIITVNRSGGTSAILKSIRNETTGLELLFNVSLLDGETITVDLTPGSKSVQSSWRGNVVGSLLPQSDFAAFSLIPGDNEISAYVPVSGATVTTNMTWQERY